MHWIDSIPPIAPLTETISTNQIRAYYRGAEPIKGFVIYTVPFNRDNALEEATIVKIMVADKTIDLDLTEVPAKPDDKIFIATVDRNNNVSEWLEVK